MNKNFPHVSKILYIKTIILFFLITIGCWAVQADDNKDALERLMLYYSHEKNGAWDKAYLFRTPLFQNTVSQQFYIKKAKQNNHGWETIKFKILDSIVTPKYAAFKIEFIEKAPPDCFAFKRTSNVISEIETSTWEKINHQWYCRDACSRMRLSLNVDLVMDNSQQPITFEKLRTDTDLD